MNSKIDFEDLNLIKQLQDLSEKAEALAEHQIDLREQLEAAEKKALEVHQKIVEEQCDVGGEG